MFLALCFVVLLALAGCNSGEGAGSKGETTTQTGDSQNSTTEAQQSEGEDGMYTPEYKPSGTEVAVMKTTQGDITIELYGKDAPIHVGNFIELAQKGFYDGTKFHRFEPSFVVQGGDPQTKELSAEEVVSRAGQPSSGLGTGNPGYQIKGEFDPAINPRKHVEGALGMARSQSPDSAGSQFYFALQPLPQLDGSYTVFGAVKDGMDVMKKLRIGDEIKSIEIKNAQ